MQNFETVLVIQFIYHAKGINHQTIIRRKTKGKKQGGLHYSIRQCHQQKGERRSNGVARFVFRQDPLVFACSAQWFRSEEGGLGIW